MGSLNRPQLELQESSLWRMTAARQNVDIPDSPKNLCCHRAVVAEEDDAYLRTSKQSLIILCT